VTHLKRKSPLPPGGKGAKRAHMPREKGEKRENLWGEFGKSTGGDGDFRRICTYKDAKGSAAGIVVRRGSGEGRKGNAKGGMHLGGN